MRFLAVLSIVIAACCASAATAAPCELISTSQIFKKIEANPSVAQCGAAAGFALNPPAGKPSAAQLERLCAVGSCRTTISFLTTLKLPSCTIAMLNDINMREIVDVIAAYCQSHPVAADEEKVLSAPGRATLVQTTATTTSTATTTGKQTVGSSGATVLTSGKSSNDRLRKNCHS